MFTIEFSHFNARVPSWASLERTDAESHDFDIPGLSSVIRQKNRPDWVIRREASQIKDEVLKEFPMATGIGKRGVARHMLSPCDVLLRSIRKRDVARHIREHMLSPSVKLASVLRSLTTLAESLRGTLLQRDPDTNEIVIDLKSTDMYLKVLTQIMNAYKMDGSRLCFANQA